MNEPCLLDEVCNALGYQPGTRMAVILERIRMLQYYIGQLNRIDMLATSAPNE